MSEPMVDTTTTGFQLVLPPDPQLLRVVRLVASGLASLAALDLDAVEEIRVAADELVSTLIENSDGAAITLDLQLTATAVVVTGTTTLPAGSQLTVDPITDRILSTVATRHSWSTEADQAVGTIERELLSS
jgi:hypothetical protein